MLPGVLFYLSTFYKRNELASRLGVFYGNDVSLESVFFPPDILPLSTAMSAISGAFSGK